MTVKLARVLASFEQAGLIVMGKESYDSLLITIEKQAEEIDALDCRIKRLLMRGSILKQLKRHRKGNMMKSRHLGNASINFRSNRHGPSPLGRGMD